MTTFTKSEKHDVNYLAAIFRIENIRAHTNADRLQIVSIFGNNVVTGLNAKAGDLYCYFPLECAISKEFLSFTNSFRDLELNMDKTKKGFFEENLRVRAARLRGEKSEGYIVPVSELERFAKDVLGQTFVVTEEYVGYDFDTFLDHQICKKYIARGTRIQNTAGKKTRGNTKRYESKLVENQFHFHVDTAHLKREVHKISPDDYIHISEKLHGTSVVISNVLCKRRLSLVDRIAQYFGANIQDTQYDKLYSSRQVIKNLRLDDESNTNHYYDSDVWGIVADKYFPCLQNGYTFYGEIVGYTPNGAYIQKNYDYGCNPGELDFYVYRMTFTNNKGDVFELSPLQVKDYCGRHGIKTPEVHYYGKARDLFPELDVENHWHDDFLQKMMEKYLEQKCHICKNDVWAEGVCLRVDKPNEWDCFKLKSFNFVMGETADRDKGEVDIESQESNVEEASE